MNELVNLFKQAILDEINYDLQVIADEMAELRAEDQADILFLEDSLVSFDNGH